MKGFRKRFFPHLYVNNLTEIPLGTLREIGIKGLLLDLDNTLVGWNRYDLPHEVCLWIQRAKQMGFAIAIVSNALADRVQYFSQALDVPGISKAQKPRRSALRSAMTQMNLSCHEVAVIGDQVFTDIWGGNRLGIYTILVHPITPREFFLTRLGRMLERIILRRFSRD